MNSPTHWHLTSAKSAHMEAASESGYLSFTTVLLETAQCGGGKDSGLWIMSDRFSK
jgi:hypothetical protein